MRRLTNRNSDNKISVATTNVVELIEHLAECEDILEKHEQILKQMQAMERQYMYQYRKTLHVVYQGKYSATHKCVELMKGVKNGR